MPLMESIELTESQFKRYSRHLSLPGVGPEGQTRLLNSKVLIVGLGGLGSPAALYLAAAGVGTLGLVDHDQVDLSNLQRQIIHSEKSVGHSKLESARESLLAINPELKIQLHEIRLSSENAMEIIKEYDVVIDGTDNFPVRYLINDACILLDKPNIYGSIFQFEGQVTVFKPNKGPCYRCLFPEPPSPGSVPTCSQAGVLGVLPGVIGTLQATEAIKVLLNKGELLVGRLLLYDALKMNFREVAFKQDEDCPVCGNNPTITSLIDYEEFCGLKQTGIRQVSARELQQKIKVGTPPIILDVREEEEWESDRIENSILIPLPELQGRLSELLPHKTSEIVVHCQEGGRSSRACQFLQAHRFEKIFNLEGGLRAWKQI
jgi:molybdopterin/thiamine biosynthesis adenylyltransferase/rhodanese-related sulfurtransferase